MAAIAYGDQVVGIVVGSLAVSMMDVQPFVGFADDASPVVPFEYLFTELLPTFQRVFFTGSDDHAVEGAFELFSAPRRVIAAVTAAPETIQSRPAITKRFAIRIE